MHFLIKILESNKAYNAYLIVQFKVHSTLNSRINKTKGFINCTFFLLLFYNKIAKFI
jgi:hypothetical protein